MRGLTAAEASLLVKMIEPARYLCSHAPDETATIHALWKRGLIVATPIDGGARIRFDGTPLGRLALRLHRIAELTP